MRFRPETFLTELSSGGFYQLTPYEGMRVSIPSVISISGADGNLSEREPSAVAVE